MDYLKGHPKQTQFVFLLVVFFALCFAISPSDDNILWRLPPLIKDLPLLINNSVEFLMFEWWPIEIYDPEIEEYEQKPLVQEITRAISRGMLFSIEFRANVKSGVQRLNQAAT